MVSSKWGICSETLLRCRADREPLCGLASVNGETVMLVVDWAQLVTTIFFRTGLVESCKERQLKQIQHK